MQVEAPGNTDAPDQQEAVGGSDAPGQEEAGDKEESILGNLSPISDDASSIGTEEYNRLTKELEIGESADDASSMDTEEYNRLLKELRGGEQSEAESAQPKQERQHKEYLSPEEIVEQAGLDAIAHSDILNKPITPDDDADLEALEAKRKEMLATAKKFANTAAAMLDERKEAANFMDGFLKREREVDESLEKVKQLRKHWEAKMSEARKDADRIRREVVTPRKIFATPTEQQPLTTPKDNMKKAAELLKKKDEDIDINYVVRSLPQQ
ncbi:hypothetical protein QYE76_041556 [Lolium multiflorum]|uniref:Uncharacterized protein n=1 Tax=Lolium multiflorum TaxID=4521 RepID=A0AAD8TFJ3_LOLMU|nr:hypothetical protein QYE76_041556 [Lolium multiflorum]